MKFALSSHNKIGDTYSPPKLTHRFVDDATWLFLLLFFFLSLLFAHLTTCWHLYGLCTDDEQNSHNAAKTIIVELHECVLTSMWMQYKRKWYVSDMAGRSNSHSHNHANYSVIIGRLDLKMTININDGIESVTRRPRERTQLFVENVWETNQTEQCLKQRKKEKNSWTK